MSVDEYYLKLQEAFDAQMAQPASEVADETKTDINVEEKIKIRYGSRVVLEHVNTQYRLHSHIHRYPNYDKSSQQQQVTCFSGSDSNDYWIVKPSHGDNNSLKLWQTEVKKGDIIQLQHYNTGTVLHNCCILFIYHKLVTNNIY